MPAPRYLRFAQSLALCSSLAMLPGCPSSTEGVDGGGSDTPSGLDAPMSDTLIAETDAPVMMTTDTGVPSDTPPDDEDAPLADAGVTDAGLECADCDCFGIAADAGRPDCYSVGLSDCCIAVGPLSPPDLPA